MGMTLRELVAAFFSWADSHLAKGTCRVYRYHFERFMGAVGDVQVDSLKAHHLLLWGKTWHELQAVKRLFYWAVEKAELLERNPFKKIPLPRAGRRKRILSRKQLAAMLRRAGRQFRAFLIGMRETIARPQEVRVLCWEELHWEGGPAFFKEACRTGQAVFILENYKSRDRRADPDTPRVILVSPRLGRLLVRLARTRATLTGHVFINCEGGPWTTNALRLQMRRLAKRLDIGEDKRGEAVVCYTLRHTMATQASASGVKDRLLADLMGHTSTRTTSRYQHLDTDHLRIALAKVKFPN
jgi:integrase